MWMKKDARLISWICNDDNWPLCDFIGERYSEALYRHKVIDSYIKVSDVVFSEEKSREFIVPEE